LLVLQHKIGKEADVLLADRSAQGPQVFHDIVENQLFPNMVRIGYSDLSEANAGLAHQELFIDADHFISKPIAPNDLAQEIKAIIKQRRPQS